MEIVYSYGEVICQYNLKLPPKNQRKQNKIKNHKRNQELSIRFQDDSFSLTYSWSFIILHTIIEEFIIGN